MNELYNNSNLIFALKEEIGHAGFFTGRKADIEYILNWAEGVKREANPSLALLARRKKGKTALVQRLYNIFYTMNDEMIIPFYYRVKEENRSQLKLANDFYYSLICQYAAFVCRKVDFMRMPLTYTDLKEVFKNDSHLSKDIKYMETCLEEEDGDKAWGHAAYAGERLSVLKDKRIIQIIDEFQYFNEFIYAGDTFKEEHKLNLCGTYHHVGASKISPTIVTGSQVSILMKIVNSMTGRYRTKLLKNLIPEEAVEAVYNYSRILDIPVNMETAAYMARLSEGDPFYISMFFKSDYLDKDLQDMDCIDEILLHETRTDAKDFGEIAGMWQEYLNSAINTINNLNGKKIVLYLAKYGDQDRTRQEIKDDLRLDISDGELETKLHAFIMADILSYGESYFRYRGPGDKYFEIIFKRMYQEEIDNLNVEKIKSEVHRELASLKGQLSYYKGLAGEYLVRDMFVRAVSKGKSLRELLHTYIEGYELSAFRKAGRKSIQLHQNKRIEFDLYLESGEPDSCDLAVEVKYWEKPADKKVVENFIDKKKKAEAALKEASEKIPGVIFFSNKPLKPELINLLTENGIMVMYGE